MSVAASDFTASKECPTYDPTDPANSNQQINVQLVLSLALGLSAFFGFCVSLIPIVIPRHCKALTVIVTSAKMERFICSAQAAER